MKVPQKLKERKFMRLGYKCIIGVDEVGMGALAGPVVVCATLFSKKFFKKPLATMKIVRDSKSLSVLQREKITSELRRRQDFVFKISYCWPKTIDRINIYRAARLAMRRAVKRLGAGDKGAIVLVDGPARIAGLEMKQLPIIKGDEKVFAIACASILAKVYRDKMMIRYARRYPRYGFEKHVGYGTRYHVARLAKFGPCEIHRKSFARLSFWTKVNRRPWLAEKFRRVAPIAKLL